MKNREGRIARKEVGRMKNKKICQLTKNLRFLQKISRVVRMQRDAQ